MEPTDIHPSLIDHLNRRSAGIFIDPLPSNRHPEAIHKSPYATIVAADIKNDGTSVIERVLLVMQPDDYDLPDAMAPVTNARIEAAWQHAAGFYRQNEFSSPPIFFSQQFDQTGGLTPFGALFRCMHTERWFHPVCPQCGQPLTLCRDDPLLEAFGQPPYAASHHRFLYCRSCTDAADTGWLYVHRKTAGMPDRVLDKHQLIAQWAQGVNQMPSGDRMPCAGCSEIDACWKTGVKAGERIDVFSFYPFYMLMVPAPSCAAETFVRMISGDPAVDPDPFSGTDFKTPSEGFFFEGQERLFLEVLFLKLTFLSQLVRQLLIEDAPEADLTMGSLGVDIAPAGTGLPAFWQFSTRILNRVGGRDTSPFAPMIPVAPRLHFLGAVWMRTLLVNSVQTVDDVFPKIARMLESWTADQDWMTVDIDTSGPHAFMAGEQVFWVPDGRVVPPAWQDHWLKSLRLGFHLIQIGLGAGSQWHAETFLSMLGDVRKAIKQELFAGSGAAPSYEKPSSALSPAMTQVLDGIIDKWKNQAALLESQGPTSDGPAFDSDDARRGIPPGTGIDAAAPLSAAVHDRPTPSGTVQAEAPPPSTPPGDGVDSIGIGLDPQQTIVLHDAVSVSSPDTPHDVAADILPPDAPWQDDGEQTIVLQPDESAADVKKPAGDMDAPPVNEPAAVSVESESPPPDDDLTATMVQNTPPPPDRDAFDDNLESTVVINPAAPPVRQPTPAPTDDDLAATLVQGSNPDQPATPSPHAEMPPNPTSSTENDMEATVVISPVAPPVRQPPPAPADDDLAATLVQGSNPDRPATPAPSPGLPPVSPPAPDDDLDSTVIINPANRLSPAVPPPAEPSNASDDDLAATLIETPRQPLRGVGEMPPPPPGAPSQSSQWPNEMSSPPDREDPGNANDGFDADDDDVMEQTVIIRSTIKKD